MVGSGCCGVGGVGCVVTVSVAGALTATGRAIGDGGAGSSTWLRMLMEAEVGAFLFFRVRKIRFPSLGTQAFLLTRKI